jgi:hypothetical protein
MFVCFDIFNRIDFDEGVVPKRVCARPGLRLAQLEGLTAKVLSETWSEVSSTRGPNS